MGDSMNDDTTANSSKIKGKKLRIGSGDFNPKNHNGKHKNTKNADLIDDNAKASISKNRTRYSSKSPFLRNSGKNKQTKAGKATEADEDAQWGLSGKAIDKRNSTKITQQSTSENEESSWVKGNISSNEKTENKKIGERRSGSMMKKQAKHIVKPQKHKINQNQPKLVNNLEEGKIAEEIEVQESYTTKFDASQFSPNRKKHENINEKEAKADKVVHKTRKCKFTIIIIWYSRCCE
jgi:hypothetical protein